MRKLQRQLFQCHHIYHLVDNGLDILVVYLPDTNLI